MLISLILYSSLLFLIELVFYFILKPDILSLFFVLFSIVWGAILVLNILNTTDYNYTFLDCGASTHPYQRDKGNFYYNFKTQLQDKGNFIRYSYLIIFILNILGIMIFK